MAPLVHAGPASPARIILVGDSTMATRTGYGEALCARFRPDVACINLARGGRSSGSFRAEGRWDQVQALLRDGASFGATYVLVQFGHNDQPGKPGRSTDLVTQFPANIARYADEARALGAVPVLVTPLTRRSFHGAWLHDDLAPWSAAVRRVARGGKFALLDLNAMSAAAVQAMGTDQADTLAQEPPPLPGKPKGAFDYTHLGQKGAMLFSGMVARELARLRPELAAVLLHSPVQRADGWAGQQGGTTGGGAAAPVVVTSAKELRTALAAGAPVIEVAGMIDMSDGRAFADSADQAKRGTIRLASNSTLRGAGTGSGLVNASVVVANALNVIIRNLNLRNPCDVAPRWDAGDGRRGNWNSQFDAITVSASTHVWIDHNSFTDAPFGDERAPIENGMMKQCHDGALDINQGSDLVTVSHNRFALHEKNGLVGSSDKAGDDAGKLRITFSHNLFENVSSRAPRVRYGQVHLYNNYHSGDRRHPVYPHRYSVGVGKRADIIAHANAYDIASARGCADVVRSFGSDSSFTDHDSTLNGAPLLPCAQASAPLWQVPYPFNPLPAIRVREHVLANAGPVQRHVVNVSATVLPASGARGVPVDTMLRMRLNRPPAPGGAGSVRIYRKKDQALVDTIHTGEEIVAIGVGRKRHVRRAAITAEGNDLVIRPHAGALAYDTEYFATVTAEGITGNWSFRTRKAPPRGPALTVDDDGEAHFRTVQGALDHAMAHYPRSAPLTITVRNGSYEELLFIRSRDRLTIRGESRDGVLIHATNNEGLNPGTGASQAAGAPGIGGGRALLLVEDADLLTLDTLTLRNDTQRRYGSPAQAETVYFNSDAGRLVARNASFFSEQDTLQLKGYAWFYRTLVAGNVDFIWGANRAALFEQSEIRSIGDSAHPHFGGYVVQARTVGKDDKGFVFLNSTLTHGTGPAGNGIPAGRTFLARSPGRVTSWDNVSFINCRMDRHIAPSGWAGSGAAREPAPNPAPADALHGWREHGSTDLAGQPLDLSQRAGGYLLDADSARRQFGSRAAVFAGFDGGKGWTPEE